MMSNNKLDDVCKILKDVEFSNDINTNNMAVRFIVAATRITNEMEWKNATNDGISMHESRLFLNSNYDTNLKENTRESLRKNGAKKLETVGLARNNESEGITTNSSKFKWYLDDDFFDLVRSYGTSSYEKLLQKFLPNRESRIQLLRSTREKTMIPIKYQGHNFKLTPGAHNILHKEVIEKFAPKFAGGSELLYVGDTANKSLIFEKSKLQQLGFPITMHKIIPDIILYNEKKRWLFLVEAVSSTGPMSIDRVTQIKNNYKGNAGLIFVTAFQNWSVYKKFVNKIAWETEIWIADFPDHMIHMNGDRFTGPR